MVPSIPGILLPKPEVIGAIVESGRMGRFAESIVTLKKGSAAAVPQKHKEF
ncbi:hypothetical protein [Bifidobacterium crudilactis]|uniref:hypothetical protein n=1 Tax=Bifidobacterium crudilactis TaxID=327277 RepID=UPI0026494650|nr:hypothetical protein [Bifidobacterium crudilactis]MDN5971668.1 hypothetical protein [Bifidobacterium crudilactis]MDN6001353.1 hypothetical protein [Bifidobacterium crudilactis]MDN6209537.1 hypothetical protein [Bifidobacterium crudilactis]MDN6466988.1 hypothetical protein [Bifidobacterium crudilactis]MDN6523058.1 hypothetical protein [Bifidobacterium crudilactis]